MKQTKTGNRKLGERQDINFINARVSKMALLARVKAGLTQKELAEKVGTKQPSIARLESGATPPSISFLNNIAIALGTYLVPPIFKSIESYYAETKLQQPSDKKEKIENILLNHVSTMNGFVDNDGKNSFNDCIEELDNLITSDK
jgi:transcriptional regulator with XRE-family HTH domain